MRYNDPTDAADASPIERTPPHDWHRWIRWMLPCIIALLTFLAISWYLYPLYLMKKGESAPYLPIHEAARQGNVAGMRQLLDKDPKMVNVYGCKRDPGGDVESFGTPFEYALRSRSPHRLDAIRLLVERGAPVNRDVIWGLYGGRTPLMTAVMDCYEDPGVISYLISRGAAVNVRDGGGKSALHYASMPCSPKVAAVLLAHGADVNAQTANGMTPLLYAASHRDCEPLLVLLLKYGADVRDTGYGDTPLHRAVDHKSAGMIRALFQAGADVNARDYRGNTPLHNLAERPDKMDDEYTPSDTERIALLLLNKNPVLVAQNRDGDTPLALAKKNSNQTLVRLLSARGVTK